MPSRIRRAATQRQGDPSPQPATVTAKSGGAAASPQPARAPAKKTAKRRSR